jgi:cytoskeletal protein CcmA (bactofilin family)
MTSNERADLRIIGDNSASGGSYDNVKIVGDCVVNGNLDCCDFRSVGDSRVEGSVKARSARIVGTILVRGSLESGDLRVTGKVDTHGSLTAEKLVVRGEINVGSGVKSDDIRLIGQTTIRENCQAERFKSEGPINIGALLTADDLDLRVHGRCKVSEIGGGRITVRRGHYSKFGEILKSLFIPVSYFKGTLTAESIEGDEIRLEDTKAKTVRARDVVIGDECEVDVLEYTGECRISSRSTVKEKRKVAT